MLPRGKDAKFKLGADHKGQAERMSRPRLGFAKSTPGYLRVPKEYYYEGHQYFSFLYNLSMYFYSNEYIYLINQPAKTVQASEFTTIAAFDRSRPLRSE